MCRGKFGCSCAKVKEGIPVMKRPLAATAEDFCIQSAFNEAEET